MFYFKNELFSCSTDIVDNYAWSHCLVKYHYEAPGSSVMMPLHKSKFGMLVYLFN